MSEKERMASTSTDVSAKAALEHNVGVLARAAAAGVSGVVKFFDQSDRDLVLKAPVAVELRKRARILAVRIAVPFAVTTDRGIMRGQPGDWLVTNHPDDDPGSDLWTISDERMQATYEVVRDVFPDA